MRIKKDGDDTTYEITKRQLMDCVIQDNLKDLRSILNVFKFDTDGVQPFTDKKRALLSTLLSFASVRAKNDAISDEFIFELTIYAAPHVDIISFLELMLLYTDYHPDKKTATPLWLIKTIKVWLDTGEGIDTQIHTLCRSHYMIVAMYLTSRKDQDIPAKCVTPILIYALKKLIIPVDAYLAYLANSLEGSNAYKVFATSNDDGIQLDEHSPEK